MKKFMRAFLCLILTAVMLFSSTTVAFAKTKVTPVITVHGLGANAIYENVGKNNQSEITNLGIGDIGTALLSNLDLISEVLKMMDPATKADKDKLIAQLKNLVANNPLNCDENGNVKAGQGIVNYWTDSLANHPDYWKNAVSSEPAIARQICESIGAKNVYAFNYDWRWDICKTADDLNDYIQNVKKQTGAKKVTLVGSSLGGSVLSAYIDKYKGNKDLERCVFINPAFQGVDVARAYAKDLKIDKKVVIKYLKNLGKSYDGGSKNTLISIVSAIGDVRLSHLVDSFNELLKDDAFVNRVYIEVLKPWIGNIPALWDCIPYDSFNKAVKTMSSIGFLDKNTQLYTKIKNYHSVQGRLKSNLKAIKKQGVQVAIFVGTGMQAIPITSKYTNNTDYLIDVKYASAGATAAKIGKKLTGKNAKGKYVSKDKAINAKTCALPDNTWFIKNLLHVNFRYGTKATKLVANIATGKVKSNLKSVKKKYGYTQFMKADSNQKLTNIKK